MKIKYESKYFMNNDKAVAISDEKVEEMINEVCNRVISENDYSFSMTGDVKIFGLPFDEDEDGEIDTIEIHICRKSEEMTLLKENGIWNPIDWEKEEKYDKRFEELWYLNKHELVDMIIEMEKEKDDDKNVYTGTITCTQIDGLPCASDFTIKSDNLHTYTSLKADYNPRKEV